MQKTKNIFSLSFKSLKLLPIAATMLLLPLSSFSQKAAPNKSADRAELNYKQRHSRITNNGDLYADGIKIKRDLSILKQAQEERIMADDEIPAENVYGNNWNSRYVNAYRSMENMPDTFKVNLKNFTIPTTGYVTSNFGARRRRMHYGIDLKVQVGDTIYASFEGKVRVKQYERRGYGYYLVVRHPNGLETVYGHLSKFLVDEDQTVKSGQPIALGGNTGRSTGSHLHYEMRFLGKPINPTDIVDFDNKVCHRDQYTVYTKNFNYPTRGSRSTESFLASASSTPKSKSGKANKYASSKVNYHRIKSGDTLGKIARKYGLSIKSLCKLNSITARTVLRSGKSLRIS